MRLDGVLIFDHRVSSTVLPSGVWTNRLGSYMLKKGVENIPILVFPQ